MKCLFIVQGEGRGHMTQALALRRMLRRAGHRVCGVVLGRPAHRPVPAFFVESMDAPVTPIASPTFALDAREQGVRFGASLWNGLMQIPALRRSLSTIHEQVQRHAPDVVVNFFEPMAGLYYRLYTPAPPMVAVAHQYMFHHPAYRFPAGRPFSRWGVQAFARLTAWGAARRLALSLYPAPDRPGQNLHVLPPLLRPEVFALPTHRTEPFVLVYVLNRGYAAAIIQWHRKHPEVRLHCFWDQPQAGPTHHYDETLTFHQLDDAHFLELMARCRGFVSTAGFESVAEAMVLGTPVQVVPVDGHYEQRCNAEDAVRAGAGIWSEQFDLSRILEAIPAYEPPGERFRAWVRSGEERAVRAIETAVDHRAARGQHLLPVLEEAAMG